jgi:hypothetical protein
MIEGHVSSCDPYENPNSFIGIKFAYNTKYVEMKKKKKKKNTITSN